MIRSTDGTPHYSVCADDYRLAVQAGGKDADVARAVRKVVIVYDVGGSDAVGQGAVGLEGEQYRKSLRLENHPPPVVPK